MLEQTSTAKCLCAYWFSQITLLLYNERKHANSFNCHVNIWLILVVSFLVIILFFYLLFIESQSQLNWTFLSFHLTEGKNKACSSGWCSWTFSSSTQARWVLTSSSRNCFRGGCSGILTKLPCCFRVNDCYLFFWPKPQ